jgi:hypothetical protein
MVKKAKSGGLLSSLGATLAKAHEAHKTDETVLPRGGSIPAGIDNGVAQLVDCYFKEYEKGDDKGKLFFYAAGIVKAPSHVNGVPIIGLRTSIIEPLCETPNKTRKTIEDHWAWILNELRKLGLDTSEIDFDSVEDAVAALKESGPHFRFRTWQAEKRKPGDPQYNPQYDGPDAPPPRIFETWAGQVQFEEDDSSGVEDDTPPASIPAKAPSSTPKPSAPAPKASAPTKAAPAPKGIAKKPTKMAAPDFESMTLEELSEYADNESEKAQAILIAKCEEAGIDPTDDKYANWGMVSADLQAASESEEEATEEEASDVSALGEAGDAGDEEAQVQLQSLAEAAGIDPDDYASWADLAAALGGGEAEEEAEEEAETVPEVKDIFNYKPTGSKKAVECEVTAVFPAKRVVNLKDLDSGKAYKSVSWDQLSNE